MEQEGHEKGTPVMRTRFCEFPQDETCWELENEYMYGDRLLVAPVLETGSRARVVYLPEGASWKDVETDIVYEGGIFINKQVTLESMPLFLKM